MAPASASVPGLSLTRLMLRDFRSWVALTVPFQSRIVVIAGPNGAGKTNLLEAISLLGPGRGLRGAKTAELGRQSAARRRDHLDLSAACPRRWNAQALTPGVDAKH